MSNAAGPGRAAIPDAHARDKGGVWNLPFARQEQTMLLSQAKYDRRNIPPLWFWRFLNPDDSGGSAPDETTYETIREHRKYAAPIAAYLYADWKAEDKARRKGGVTETLGTVPLGFSRAEARRLGVLLNTFDDKEGLVGDSVRRDPVFIPRPGDIFRARDRLYEVLQFAPEWWGATQIIQRWMGTASMIRDTSSNPGMPQLPAASSFVPPQPSGIKWPG